MLGILFSVYCILTAVYCILGMVYCIQCNFQPTRFCLFGKDLQII